MSSKELLESFLESVGKPKEINQFQHFFKQLPSEKFALIYISKEILSEIDVLNRELKLMNEIGLCPLLVCADDIEGREGLDFPIKDVLHIDSQEELSINELDVQQALQSKQSFIVSPIVSLGDLEKAVFSLDIVSIILKTFCPQKYIYLTLEGCLKNKQGQALPFINGFSLDHYEDEVSEENHDVLKELLTLLDINPSGAVIITKPKDLLKEILTIKGVGTFIKIHRVVSTKQLEKHHESSLKTCLETAFERRLNSHYFEDAILELVYQESFEGVAVMKAVEKGIPYLDKFAVEPLFSGTGLGTSLFKHVMSRYPKFLWRASQTNPLISFYYNYADGHVKKGEWLVFWRGYNQSELGESIEKIAQRGSSFED